VLLCLTLPSIILLCVEHYTTAALPKPPKTMREQFVPHQNSFMVHLVFVLIFSAFVQIAPLTLTLHRNYSFSENNELLFIKSASTVVGEITFAILYKWLYLPSIMALSMPCVILAWYLNSSDFTALLVVVSFYGFCTGVLNVWVVHRVLTQWFFASSPNTLPLLIFLLALAAVPGVAVVNLWMWLLEDADGVIHHASVLMMAFGVSLSMLIVVAFHWVLFYKFEANHNSNSS
jgi:hypothetical protein